jgi:hypothetical protein
MRNLAGTDIRASVSASAQVADEDHATQNENCITLLALLMRALIFLYLF